MNKKATIARIVLGCGLATITGVLLTLSFAPYDLWWLAWIAFVPMAVAQYRVLPRAWSALAPALGIGGFVAGTFGGDFFPHAAAWYMRWLPLLVAAIVFVASRRERASHERDGYALWPLRAAIGWVAI